MRVTNRTLVRTFMNNLNTNLNNMRRYQDQMSSGKEIRRPSDNPSAVVRAMELYDSINRNSQYLSNIEDSIGWLDTSDMALGQIGDSLQRIKQLVTAAANGTNSESEHYACKTEIEQRIQEIAQSGNTVFDGRFIFGGNKTTEKPFGIDNSGAITYNGDSKDLVREISPNVVLKINAAGSELMEFNNIAGEPKNLSVILESVVTALENKDFDALSGDVLGDISDSLDNVLRLRAEMGAKSNRAESVKGKNEEETLNMTEILSKTEDIDIAEKVMEYKVMETVYQASLMAGAKVIQPSLIDFLR